MNSMAVMNQNHANLSNMEKSEVSKSLFALVSWDEILRSGVFLAHRDVRYLHFNIIHMYDIYT